MGYYVTSVVDRKENFDNSNSYSLVVLIIYSSSNNRTALSCGYAQRVSAKTRVILIYMVPLCTSLDKLGRMAIASDVEVDDQLIFGLAGAYGFTESMPFFFVIK